MARAGCQEPLRREQVRGPQHEVKPAASTHSQPESRAAHFTAKATSPAPRSGGARAGGLGGVGGAARGHGVGRNTRGPSAQPESGQRGPHKPKVKAGAAQRESEGAIVLRMAVKQNAAGGKGPCGGHGVSARTREGMAGETGPNSPERRAPLDQVRQLQRRLWAAAKRSPKRCFHALMDRIWRDDVLREAWRRVKRNRGSAGVDRETLAEIEQRGVDAFLEELGTALRAGTYRPQLVLRRYIPKADGRRRPLGIPTVRDRVAQMAATLVLSPIFEADFRRSSFGFRPKRSATEALEVLRVRGARGGCHVLDADICDYFSSIDHEKLLTLVRQRISDRRVLRLLRLWLAAGVLEAGQVQRTLAGTPQGVLYPSARGCRSNEPYRRPCRRLQRPVLGSPSTAPAARFGVPVDGSSGPFWGPRRRLQQTVLGSPSTANAAPFDSPPRRRVDFHHVPQTPDADRSERRAATDLRGRSRGLRNGGDRREVRGSTG